MFPDFPIPMAESILTSINLAGGSFNVFYDTILAQGSGGYSYTSEIINIPSGWKVILIINARNGNTGAGLLSAVPIFTVATGTIGGIGVENGSIVKMALVENITATSFRTIDNVTLDYIVAA